MRRPTGLLGLTLAVLATGCGRGCREAPPSVAAPIQAVTPPAGVAAPAALPVAPPPRPAAPRPVLFFPTAVGARWVYEERAFGERVGRYTEVVTAVRDRGPVKVVAVDRVAEDGAIDPVGEFEVSDGRVTRVGAGHGSPLVEYRGPWPDRAGADGFGPTVVSSLRLPQPVKVPAGTFTAVPVVAGPDGGTSGDLVLRYAERAWYAPGVGLVRREAGPYETVLVSFTPAPE
jgi:hypothetical protein